MGVTHFLASDFDFELPPELIAQQPAPERDQSRLLVLTAEEITHHGFAELPELIARAVGAGALLVLNDTRVLPARLRARKLNPPQLQATTGAVLGGQVELLLCEPVLPASAGCAAGAAENAAPSSPAAGSAEANAPASRAAGSANTNAPAPQRWRCMYRSSKPLRAGAELRLEPPPGAATAELGELGTVRIVDNEGGGYVVVEFAVTSPDELLALLGRLGEVPLPPYIHRDRPAIPLDPPAQAAQATDRERYQTVFAKVPGSVAAPTAGLHFTPQVLAALQARGVQTATVTLHVGPGTFSPLRSDDPNEHVMHLERYHVPSATVAAIAAAKAAGRPVVAVGTTVVRTLESATPPGESVPRPGWGTTQLFIYPRGPGQPQHRFQVVDALLTNFHLPRSTLLMLVAAFAGRRRVLAAYAEAVAQRYRFFSFGDAMLIPARLIDPECQPAATARAAGTAQPPEVTL